MQNDAYVEIEICMQQHMQRPYIAKENDYRAIKQLLASEVPLDWILEGIERVFSIRAENASRIRSFSYVAEILKDDWAKELVKRDESVDPIDFKTRANSSQNGYQSSHRINKAGRATDPYTQSLSRDERYTAFYRLFPDG